MSSRDLFLAGRPLRGATTRVGEVRPCRVRHCAKPLAADEDRLGLICADSLTGGRPFHHTLK
jgi:hypothetical protein